MPAPDSASAGAYVANHPRAAAELDRLLRSDLQLESFFEGCRLLLGTDLSLAGHLLEPVQRICRYPLLFRE